MELIKRAADAILHMDRHLGDLVDKFGPWAYALLFLIIFCETGLVVTPFLPGDSLLFTIGALCGVHVMSLPAILLMLPIAAILGDNVNYFAGRKLGPKVFRGQNRWLNKRHLDRTHSFYEVYGGKTLVIARFIPIVRTFAPFVAGIGQMAYTRFISFCVAGGLLWIWGVTLLGYWFGNREFVKKNFGVVIIAIIVISVLPAVVEFLKARSARNSSRA
ncbi:MAG TPA: DedA family protein [Verrucomicrobiae bacterium]|jgi:membrane-associated protein